MADYSQAPLIHTVDLPTNDNTTSDSSLDYKYRMPGMSYESSDVSSTPNVSKYFDGTTETVGTLAPSEHTYGDIFIVPSAPQGQGTTVTWNQIISSGSKIAEIGIDGTITEVYAPNGGSSGSTVSWTQIEPTTSKKIATISVDGVATDVYAPNGAQYTLTQDTTDGHKLTFSKDGTAIATITIPDDNTTNSSLTNATSTDGKGTTLTLTDSDTNTVTTTFNQQLYAESVSANNYYPVVGAKADAGAIYSTPTSKLTDGAVSSKVSYNPSTGDLASTTLTVGDSTNSWKISIDSSGNMLIV